jgi:hypothetical protein
VAKKLRSSSERDEDSGRSGGGKDSLGKLIHEYGRVDPATLAIAIAGAILGLIVAGVAVAMLEDPLILALVGGVVLLIGIGVVVNEFRTARTRLEIRKKGVRFRGPRGVQEIDWAEMTRVSIDKTLGRGPVLRVIHNDLGIVTYRGKGVRYNFTFRSGFGRIVANANLIRRGPDPQTLLKLIEKIVEPTRVVVREPETVVDYD